MRRKLTDISRTRLGGNNPLQFAADPDTSHAVALPAWWRIDFAAGSCRLLDRGKTSTVAGRALELGPVIFRLSHFTFPRVR